MCFIVRSLSDFRDKLSIFTQAASSRVEKNLDDKAIPYSGRPFYRASTLSRLTFSRYKDRVSRNVASEGRAREKLLVLRPDVIAMAETYRSSNYSETFSTLPFPCSTVVRGMQETWKR